MKIRKTKEIKRVLSQKGFVLNPSKDHHEYYSLWIDGKKQNIYTYLSHSKDEYEKHLMGRFKQQLKFTETDQAEDFFDCPMSGEDYVKLLKENGNIT